MNGRLLQKPRDPSAAIIAVKHLLSRGYTAEKAKAEICMGSSWPDGGYEIRHGKIEAPMFSRQFFDFAEIERIIEQGEAQPDLFASIGREG